MKLRNVNPVGEVDLPLVGRQGEPVGEAGVGCLERGEVFDVSADHARILLAQRLNYEPADDEANALAAELDAPPVEADDEPNSTDGRVDLRKDAE